jgi:hypothetical protein
MKNGFLLLFFFFVIPALCKSQNPAIGHLDLYPMPQFTMQAQLVGNDTLLVQQQHFLAQMTIVLTDTLGISQIEALLEADNGVSVQVAFPFSQTLSQSGSYSCRRAGDRLTLLLGTYPLLANYTAKARLALSNGSHTEYSLFQGN